MAASKTATTPLQDYKLTRLLLNLIKFCFTNCRAFKLASHEEAVEFLCLQNFYFLPFSYYFEKVSM